MGAAGVAAAIATASAASAADRPQPPSHIGAVGAVTSTVEQVKKPMMQATGSRSHSQSPGRRSSSAVTMPAGADQKPAIGRTVERSIAKVTSTKPATPQPAAGHRNAAADLTRTIADVSKPVTGLASPVLRDTTAPVVTDLAKPVAVVTTPVAEVVRPVLAPVAKVVEPVLAPVADRIVDPIVRPITGPITDPITEPITEPVPGPITGPITGSGTEPGSRPGAGSGPRAIGDEIGSGGPARTEGEPAIQDGCDDETAPADTTHRAVVGPADSTGGPGGGQLPWGPPTPMPAAPGCSAGCGTSLDRHQHDQLSPCLPAAETTCGPSAGAQLATGYSAGLSARAALVETSPG